jgi:hypothetical protein
VLDDRFDEADVRAPGVGAAPPYGLIAQALTEGRAIPFLGAAASNAGVPDGPSRLPDGAGLASQMIKQWEGYPGGENDPLTQVAQFYEECVAGRPDVYRHLRGLFFEQQRNAAPPPTAMLIAEVKPPSDSPFVVMTTNYDCQIEHALEQADRPYAVVIQVTTPWSHAPNKLWIRRSDTTGFKAIKTQDFTLREYAGMTLLYKLHGGFAEELDDDEDTLVVTEADYIRFLASLATKTLPPNAIVTHILRDRRLLFLGYSLADWNLRVILHQLNARRPRGRPVEKSWGVRMNVSPLEQAFWEKRDVVLFDMDLARFVAQIRQKLAEMHGAVAGQGRAP